MTLIEQLEKVKGHVDVVLGCFDAACGEGLYDRLAEADTHDVGSLADLVQRRLLFAHEPARGALELLASLVEQVKAMEWQPIETKPTDEIEPFQVLLPGNDVCDSLVLQVSSFEGRMYPDVKDGLIDWEDAVTGATHWRRIGPLPRPSTQEPR